MMNPGSLSTINGPWYYERYNRDNGRWNNGQLTYKKRLKLAEMNIKQCVALNRV